MWPWILTNFFVIKPTRCTDFPNLLRHETLHVSGSSSAHLREFIHCTLGTGICHTSWKTGFEKDQDGTEWINSWWWAEELPEISRVSCRSKLGKLVHLVGFIINRLFLLCYVKQWRECWMVNQEGNDTGQNFKSGTFQTRITSARRNTLSFSNYLFIAYG
jgi:hypothetical protein